MPISMGFKVFAQPDMTRFEGDHYLTKVADAMDRKSIPEVKIMFQQSVMGWEHRVEFVHRGPEISPGNVRATVFPSGENANLYALVSLGSPPHPIPAGAGGMLKFQPGYRAGTSPRMLNSQAKQRSGNFVTAMSIPRHPGFEARNFSKQIKELYEPIYKADLQEALRE